jgi:AraC family transcriptional regulator, carnitine catabolism transcriptional activator
MLIPVEGDFTTASDCKSVFVLASFEPDRAVRERQVIRWLKRIAPFGVELCGIENGSLVLAEAGLLNGHKVAVHWDNLIGFQERYPATRPVSELYARSGERITCAGAAAILDMMVAWIGWRGEADLAAEVAEHLLLGKPRAAETEQRVAPTAASSVVLSFLDAAVAQAQVIMREHIDEPLSCGEIARRVGLSQRQFERRFKDELRCSVLQKYRLIRMTRAHQLLQQTELSVTEIAFSCGFSSQEYFCRLYRSVFHCSPSKDRRQSTTAPVLRQPQVSRTGRRPRRNVR